MREFCQHDPCGYHATTDVDGELLCGIHAYARSKRKTTEAFRDEVKTAASRFSMPMRVATVSRRTVIVYLDEIVARLEKR